MQRLNINLNKKLEVLYNESKAYNMPDIPEETEEKIKDLKKPLLLMVVGDGNYGKSTLINGLVGRKVAPVSRIPKTWKIDLYNNIQGEEEAGLVWKKSANQETIEELVTIERAKEISDEQESLIKKNSTNKEAWKSDLVRINWKYKMLWPEMKVSLVDTPGFSQLRANTVFRNVDMFHSSGIQFEASDGFEYYYGIADVVLWCLRADKLNDKEALLKMQNVHEQGKNIIGIITYIDKVPKERWNEIIISAKGYFGEYIDEFYPCAAGAKSELKEQTISALRRVLEGKFARSEKEVKYKSVLKYYNNQSMNMVKKLYRIVSDVFLDNLDKKEQLISELETHIKKYSDYATEQILSEIKRMHKKAIRSLPSLWNRSNDNVINFKRLVKDNAINEEVVYSTIQTITDELNNNLRVLNYYINEQSNWKMLKFGTNEIISVMKPIGEKVQDIKLEKIDFSLSISIDRDFFGTLDSRGLLNAVISTFSKETRAVNSAEDAVDEFYNTCYEQAEKKILNNTQDYHEGLLTALNNSFEKITGGGINDITKNTLRIECSYNRLEVYPTKKCMDTPYKLENKVQQCKITHLDKLIKYNPDIKIKWKNYCLDYINDLLSKVYKYAKYHIDEYTNIIVNDLRNKNYISPHFPKKGKFNIYLYASQNIKDNKYIIENNIDVHNVLNENKTLIYNSLNQSYLKTRKSIISYYERTLLLKMNEWDNSVKSIIITRISKIIKEKSGLFDLLFKYNEERLTLITPKKTTILAKNIPEFKKWLSETDFSKKLFKIENSRNKVCFLWEFENDKFVAKYNLFELSDYKFSNLKSAKSYLLTEYSRQNNNVYEKLIKKQQNQFVNWNNNVCSIINFIIELYRENITQSIQKWVEENIRRLRGFIPNEPLVHYQKYISDNNLDGIFSLDIIENPYYKKLDLPLYKIKLADGSNIDSKINTNYKTMIANSKDKLNKEYNSYNDKWALKLEELLTSCLNKVLNDLLLNENKTFKKVWSFDKINARERYEEAVKNYIVINFVNIKKFTEKAKMNISLPAFDEIYNSQFFNNAREYEINKSTKSKIENKYKHCIVYINSFEIDELVAWEYLDDHSIYIGEIKGLSILSFIFTLLISLSGGINVSAAEGFAISLCVAIIFKTITPLINYLAKLCKAKRIYRICYNIALAALKKYLGKEV